MTLIRFTFFLAALQLLGCASPLQNTAVSPLQTVASSGRPASSFQQEFLQRINKVRSEGCKCGKTFMPAVPPLSWNYQLQQAAILHAEDMRRKDYFSHTSLEGRTSRDRIFDQGYTIKGFKYIAVGENIAQGQRSIAEVMNAWLKSEGHCRNIMNPNFKEVGISIAGGYWVQDFGGRR